MTLYLIIGLILIFGSYLYFRTKWLFKHVGGFLTVMEIYFSEEQQKNLTEEQKREFLRLWPVSHIYLEFYKWDFMRYVVHQDIYQDAVQIAINHTLSILKKLTAKE